MDSEGFTEFITPGRLMLMKSGKIFHHEEAVHENVEGLQIFIRPGQKDNRPEVIFEELGEIHSENKWRLIASPDKGKRPLQLSSQTWIYDIRISPRKIFNLPQDFEENLHCLLYVFQGSMTINDHIQLGKGESLFIQGENIHFQTNYTAEIVLFVTDKESPYYAGGMYSGNQK